MNFVKASSASVPVLMDWARGSKAFLISSVYRARKLWETSRNLLRTSKDALVRGCEVQCELRLLVT